MLAVWMAPQGRLGAFGKPQGGAMAAQGPMLAAWMALLGRFGAFGEPQGGAMAAQGPPRVGPIHAALCVERGGVP